MKNLIYLLTVLLISCFSGFSSPSFVGVWQIKAKYDIDKEGVIHIPPVRHPSKLEIVFEGENLIVKMFDQRNQKVLCNVVEVFNQGNELLFYSSKGRTHEASSFMPLHRVKLVDGKLIGYTFSDRVLVQWKGHQK